MKPRRNKTSRGELRERSAGRERDAAAMTRQGVKRAEIARRLGVAPAYVNQLQKRAGVQTDYYREVNHDYFASITTEAQAYWLGFLLADGNVDDKGYVRLKLARVDAAHVDQFRTAVGSTHKLGTTKRGACCLAIYSPKMAADLLRHGITPRKSLTAVPWGGPAELMRHWFRGVVDGDGWLTYATSQRRWNVGLVGSRAVLESFVKFAAGVCGTEVRPRPKRRVWTVEVGGNRQARCMADALYSGATVALPRKLSTALAILAAFPVPPNGGTMGGDGSNSTPHTDLLCGPRVAGRDIPPRNLRAGRVEHHARDCG